MELTLKRIARRAEYTIGRLYIDGRYFCDTLEDYDRLHFGGIKVAGRTAIPAGTYQLNFTYSPRFGRKEPYHTLSNGLLPIVVNVPQFSGVRIHIGNSASDTEGCILVGRNREVGRVLQSRDTYTALIRDYIKPAFKRGERMTIKVE